MRQILLLIILFFVGQWLLKKLRRITEREEVRAQGESARREDGSARAHNPNARQGSAASAPQLPDPLVRCAECGVHTPRSESIVSANRRFCCAEHARRFAAHPTGRDAR
jgi:uncharacterized protein